MKTKTMKTLMMILVSVCLMVACNSTDSPKSDGVAFKKQHATRLKAMLQEREFLQATQLIDSILVVYPDDPQSFMMLGWMADVQGDSLSARRHYQTSISIYDSLIAAKRDYSDEINRAFVIQLLDGPDAYLSVLDSLKQVSRYAKDSLCLEGYKAFVLKDKDDLFRKDSCKNK